MGPLDSPSDLSQGHASSVVGPQAGSSEGKACVNPGASEESVSSVRERGAAEVTRHFAVGERRTGAMLCQVLRGFQGPEAFR